MRLRVILLAALATFVGASLASAVEPYNTSARWSCFSGTCVIGHAQADVIQLLTDGTGEGEILVPADVFDFADFSDSLNLDADTTITMATGTEFTIAAAAQVGIDELFTILVDQADDADATDVLQAIRIELASESGDAGDTIQGIVITAENGTANTVIDAAIVIDNEETTASTLTDAILITSTGVAAGVTDAIDASAANIVNAINIGANLIMGTDDSLSVGATDDTVILDSNDSAGTYTCTDADANANCAFAGGGTGVATLGAATNGSATIVTDGGTVTVDGYVSGQQLVSVIASGALTVNAVNVVTSAADADIPDGACNAAADVGNWVTVVVRDDSEAVSLTSDDASNVFIVPGLSLDAGDEVDSEGGATSNGDHITVVCSVAESWITTSMHGTWADGGAAD